MNMSDLNNLAPDKNDVKMFSSVHWMEAKTHSVINSDTLIGEAKVGCTTYAWYKNKPYEVRLLRMSDDFNTLKKLKVTKDGFIREFNTSDALASTSKVSILKERSTAVKSKSTKKSKKTTSKLQEMLPPIHESVDGSDDNEIDAGLEVCSKPYEIVGQNLILDTDKDFTEKVESNHVSPDGPKQEVRSQSSSAVTSGLCTDNVEHTGLPVPSEETLCFIERLCQYLRRQKLHGGALCMTKQALASSAPQETPSTGEWVPLLPKYPEVLIERRVCKGTTRLHKENPVLMGVRLLKNMVDDGILCKCTAGGLRNGIYPEVPKDIINAIEVYVAVYSTKTLSQKLLTKAINNMIQEKRFHFTTGKRREKVKNERPKKPKINPAAETNTHPGAEAEVTSEESTAEVEYEILAPEGSPNHVKKSPETAVSTTPTKWLVSPVKARDSWPGILSVRTLTFAICDCICFCEIVLVFAQFSFTVWDLK